MEWSLGEGGSSAWRAPSCGSSGHPAAWIKGPLWAADGSWPGLEEGEGDGDGQAHKDCLYPPPSTHMIPLLQKNPQLWGCREVYSWVYCIKPQGETSFTLNGKQVYLVTSALVFPHVVISVSHNLSTSFPCVLLTVSWSVSHFCLLAAVRAQTTATEQGLSIVGHLRLAYGYGICVDKLNFYI